jgi:hypothetical protein
METSPCFDGLCPQPPGEALWEDVMEVGNGINVTDILRRAAWAAVYVRACSSWQGEVAWWLRGSPIMRFSVFGWLQGFLIGTGHGRRCSSHVLHPYVSGRTLSAPGFCCCKQSATPHRFDGLEKEARPGPWTGLLESGRRGRDAGADWQLLCNTTVPSISHLRSGTKRLAYVC